MTHRHPPLACSLLVLGLALAACDQGETPIGGFDDEGCSDPTAADGADSGDAPLELAVDCSFAFAGAIETTRIEANAEYEARVVGGDLSMAATLSDDEFEGRSFSISIFSTDGTVSTSVLYQVAPGTRPINEFWGQHGFTGLHSVREPASGETVQWACFARDPADPVQGWEE